MGMQLVVFLHVLFVVFWAGPGLYFNLVLMPRLRALSPEDAKAVGPFIAGTQRAWSKILGMVVIPVVFISGFANFMVTYGFRGKHAHVTAAVLVLICYVLFSRQARRAASAMQQGNATQAAQAAAKSRLLAWVLFALGIVTIALGVLPI